MSKTPTGRKVSNADLGARILAGWARMTRVVPDGPRHNRRLAAHFGLALRDVEHVRDTRNRVAHPGPAIRRADLERAVAIIRRTERRAGRRTSNRPAGRRPRNATRTAAPKRPAGRGVRFGSLALLVALSVVAGAAIVLWFAAR